MLPLDADDDEADAAAAKLPAEVVAVLALDLSTAGGDEVLLLLLLLLVDDGGGMLALLTICDEDIAILGAVEC